MLDRGYRDENNCLHRAPFYMIFDSHSNSYFDGLPFLVSFNEETMTATVDKGRIYNCYNNCGNEFSQAFSNGCRYYDVPKTTLEIAFDDWLFLDVRYEVPYGNDFDSESVYKVTKLQRDEGTGHEGKQNPVLIWKAPAETGGGGEQFLSENIFIQDHDAYREVGFQIKRTGYTETQDLYKINPGFVVCGDSDFVEYIQGFSWSQSKGEVRRGYRIKVSFSASISNASPVNDGNYSLINGFSITGAVLEEDSEDEAIPVYLSFDGNALSGFCFIDESSFGAGNIHLFPVITTRDRAFIEPAFSTQVRGAKFYKNGVSTSGFSGLIADGEDGFYPKIIETIVYDKYQDFEGVVTKIGTHTIVKTYTPAAPGRISETEPVISIEIEEDTLGENEFYLEPPIEHTVSPDGEEMSDSAYGECKAKAIAMEFEPLESWSGDMTAVFNGAGKDGAEYKLDPFVVHAERRFKKVGSISPDIEKTSNLPSEFEHHSSIQWDDSSEEDTSGSVPYDSDSGIYIDPDWTDVDIKDDGVYGKELVDTCSAAQSSGGFLYREVTREGYDKYQTLTFRPLNTSFVR